MSGNAIRSGESMLASKRLRLIAGSFHRVAAATTVEILISISLLRSHYNGYAGMRPERRSAAGMKGGLQPPSAPILAESGKSREREGSALAVRELFFLRVLARFWCANYAGRT